MPIPVDDASPLAWLLFEQSGVVTWRQAVAATSPAKVRHLITSKRWRRICRGILINQHGPLTQDQEWWTAVLAAGEGAVLAGLAAARAGGLRGSWRRDVIDVLVPEHRRRADLLRRLPLGLPAVRVRRARRLPAEDVQRARPDRTGMARSLVDVAQWATTDDEARAVIAAAAQQRLVLPREILSVLESMPRAHRRALVLETVHDVGGGAQSLAEIDFVRLCRRFRLPHPDLQEPRIDRSGRRRYLDAYWRRWHLHVEIDGAHHMDVREWAADMRRQNEIWVAGDRILRFPAWLVRRQPEQVAIQIRAALVAAGWRPE